MHVIGRRYDTGEPVRLELAEGRIARVLPCPAAAASHRLGPGLVDLQVNGYGGQEFIDRELTVEQVAQVATALDAEGVTCFFPTATTHSYELLSHTLRVLAEACDELPEVSDRVAGIHLEGPYISSEDGPRGAHPRAHCRPPDWDEFRRLQDAAAGRIRLLTMSPEYPGAIEFIRRVADTGVLVALGHTSATPEQIRQAAAAGARLSTHLGNGAHGQIRRHPNYIWEQLADDRLTASLIVDGHHLPPAVVQCFVRAKQPRRCVLVSDITGLGGMPPGRYEGTSIGDVEVLEDGRLVVAGQRQYLAGAALPLRCGVTLVQRFAGVAAGVALEMASVAPAVLAGVPPTRLEVGAPANLILYDEPPEAGGLRILATLNRGRVVYRDSALDADSLNP